MTCRKKLPPLHKPGLDSSSRPWPTPAVRLTIDLGALAYNFRQLRQWCGPQVKIMAVIKADAYGHGLLPAAATLAAAGADYFGVANLTEGLALRQAGFTLPTVLLLGLWPAEAAAVVAADLEPMVYLPEQVQALHAAAREQGKTARIHIKVDTGMNRLGLAPEELPAFLDLLAGLPHLELAGLSSHFATADAAEQAGVQRQLALFRELCQLTRARGFTAAASHIANSAAILYIKEAHLEMVRAGIALYGSQPSLELPLPLNLRPVMSFRTQVLQVKNLPAGAGISYGWTYITSAPCRLAVLPVGYCNGYSRLLSNRGQVLIRGQRAPIRGRVCMNLTMVEVTDLPEISVGEPVTLLGQDGADAITADELAGWANTISYEVYCLLGNSNYRHYINPDNHETGR